jgi:hypothetical protein
MNLELKTQWVAALRSGKYKQATGTLHNQATDEYCCLGVLICIQGKTVEEALDINPDTKDYVRNGVLNSSWVPDNLSGGMTETDRRECAYRNDGTAGHNKHTFEQIADYIETTL